MSILLISNLYTKSNTAFSLPIYFKWFQQQVAPWTKKMSAVCKWTLFKYFLDTLYVGYVIFQDKERTNRFGAKKGYMTHDLTLVHPQSYVKNTEAWKKEELKF